MDPALIPQSLLQRDPESPCEREDISHGRETISERMKSKEALFDLRLGMTCHGLLMDEQNAKEEAEPLIVKAREKSGKKGVLQ